MQFKNGDIVVYGNLGLCRVKGTRFMSFASDRPKENYYILSTCSGSASTCYVPIRTGEDALRLPLTQQEIHSLLEKAKDSPLNWTENRQIRYDSFHAILANGVSAELVALLHCLFQRKQLLSEQKKTLSSSDDAIFTSAEKLLHEEFSFSLGIDKNEVNTYISNFFEG